jgi:hypothetical protein
MSYKVIDNFLPQDVFIELQKNMLGPDIEWGYNSFVVRNERTDPYDFQFTHTFYHKCQPLSHRINLIDPILQILNPSAIVRIKANLLTRTEKIVINQYHYDHHHFDGKIAIFYVNTNNGYTIFEDGTKIDSIENRLLIFDGNTLHTGTTCTDQKTRVLINFVYYQWTDATL